MSSISPHAPATGAAAESALAPTQPSATPPLTQPSQLTPSGQQQATPAQSHAQMDTSSAPSSSPAVLPAAAPVGNPADAPQPAAKGDSAHDEGKESDERNKTHNNSKSSSNSSAPPAGDAKDPSNDLSSLLPPASTALHKFLNAPIALDRYADAATLHQQYVQELRIQREHYDAFVARCNPPGSASLVLPRAMNLDFVKNARFQEVPGQADIYKEHREQLRTIQTDTTKKVYEVMLKAKQAHIAALEKRAGALTFITTQQPSYREFVENYASRYNKQYGLASSAPQAFPVTHAVNHFRDFLTELIQDSVMRSAAEGLKQDELGKQRAEESRAAQELVVNGATNGKTITMIADAAVKRQLEPMSSMLQIVKKYIADDLAKQDTEVGKRNADEVKSRSLVLNSSSKKQQASAKPSQAAQSSSSSSSAQAPPQNNKDKPHSGFKRSRTEKPAVDGSASWKKSKKYQQARPASVSGSNLAPPFSSEDQPRKRRMEQEDKGKHQQSAASAKKARKDARPNSSSAAPTSSASESSKNSQGGARAAAGSSKANLPGSKAQSQAHAGKGQGKQGSEGSSKQ